MEKVFPENSILVYRINDVITFYIIDKGLVPRICESMFDRIARESAKDSRTTYNVEVSFMEVI
jgi:ATP-dependent Clp protease ATP-binding subunit ClpA